jgi:uncharacterized protein (TIGR00255 family)
MTGFGRGQKAVGGLDLSVEINSVNRRNLEVSVSLPREWQTLERDIQNRLRQDFSRGKLHVTLQAVPSAAEGGFYWDEEGLRASFRRLGGTARELGIAWPPDGDALVRLAALNKVEAALPEPETIRQTVLELVMTAASGLAAMRAAEGEALDADLRARADALRKILDGIRELSAGTVPRYREMLHQRLQQADLDLDLDDERVLKEIAIFADRCDTCEEQTRLDSHLAQFDACLGSGSPVGRKLEFILQEINREFNTVGSKANDIEVSRLVIEAKNEIERIREQIQNIE